MAYFPRPPRDLCAEEQNRSMDRVEKIGSRIMTVGMLVVIGFLLFMAVVLIVKHR